MMQTAESRELGCASVALMLGLLDVLASKDILSRDDLNTIVVAALGKLEPTQTIGPTNGAIELIQRLLPEIHGSL